MLNELIKITKQILADKYSDASVIFLAGSIIRGEGTAHSDLDLVVIFDALENAYRESFYYQGFPVEAFVHDRQTLNYFMLEVDRPSGFPVMAQMVLEGVEIPLPSELSQSLKRRAASVIEKGPPKLNEEEINKLRYDITNLVDDIRQPRSKEELIASGTELYGVLANYYFRVNNLWSAKNKSIPRVLNKIDPELCLRFCDSFEELFSNGRSEKVIGLAEDVLKSKGGFLFEGHKLEAPAIWREPMS